MPNARGQPWGTHFSALARGGYPNPSPGAGYPAQLPEPVPPPAASAPISDFSAPPPPMLRDSSEFQTIVTAGANPLDRIYKASKAASKQKEIEDRQNIPLENIDLREKLNYSKEHGYRPTQGNLLQGIENWLGAAYKTQNSPFDNSINFSLFQL